MPEPVSREELTRTWSDALGATAYVARSDAQITHLLRGLLDRLIDALTQTRFSPRPAADVGAQLVKQGFVGAQSLGATVEFLAQALPAHDEWGTVERLPGKVASLLGELASGYATALRRRTLDQQEDVKSALVRTIGESEARFREVFTSTPVGMAISELNGDMTKTNGALSDIVGYDLTQLVGRDVTNSSIPTTRRR